MKLIKDFFYNISDIIVALIIIAIASGVILWRMDIMIDYPKTVLREDSSVTVEKDLSYLPENDATEEEALWVDGLTTKEITITIDSGMSATEAVNVLIDAGLIKDYDEYSELCNELELNEENISSGEFKFIKGSTKESILKSVLIQ